MIAVSTVIPGLYSITALLLWPDWKKALVTCSVLFATVGATLTGIGVTDFSTCIDLMTARIMGVVYIGVAIILAAITSWPCAQVPEV
ncbi:hypothetical protein BO86DRAFT_125747 [Aspergillus japonicus CBS 114.51]|uniref:Uncharacterized protein n=1 Tax=Aspergillus japonicus CBS 114.51 TaxID=1448312 RepID=A0A8T8WXV1_ASPJA|nr:hypothetical protein BO86DRAFT_125747 [Aspergillus japonicus CBS 114.51]RAH80665.1 hypothetical protein BO86DRAFT_125747 [Aspergillus japonicus CBS 114.51]